MMLTLMMKLDLQTKQVDYSNAFVQAQSMGMCIMNRWQIFSLQMAENQIMFEVEDEPFWA